MNASKTLIIKITIQAKDDVVPVPDGNRPRNSCQPRANHVCQVIQGLLAGGKPIGVEVTEL